MKPNQTAVDRIIHYSILLWDIKLTLFQLRKTMLLMRNLNFTSPTFKDLTEVEMALKRRETEIQYSCNILLDPLLEHKDFGHKKLGHWSVSVGEIAQGYCEYREILAYDNDKAIEFGKEYILLLTDYEDNVLGKFYKGELIPFTIAQHFIDKIPPRKIRPKGLYEVLVQTIERAILTRSSKQFDNDQKTG